MIGSIGLAVLLCGLFGYLVVPYTFLTSFVCVEMILLGGAVYGLGGGVQVDDLEGQYTFLVTLTVAAAESAVGLAVLVQLYRIRGDVEVVALPFLKA